MKQFEILCLPDEEATIRAARTLQLDVDQTPRPFHYNALPSAAFDIMSRMSPTWAAQSPAKVPDCDLILRWPDRVAPPLRRRPHEVGIYRTDQGLVAIADLSRMGRGLSTLIGKKGDMLLYAYNVALLQRWREEFKAAPERVRRKCQVILEIDVKRVRVTIAPTGEMKIEAIGMVGTECDKHLDEFTRLAGLSVTSEEKKPEYFQTEQVAETVSEGQS